MTVLVFLLVAMVTKNLMAEEALVQDIVERSAGDWCENPGKYLGGYANRPNKFNSLSEAQKKCLERGTNCGGVTYEPHSRKYTLRKSKELKDNGGNTAEITWVYCAKDEEEKEKEKEAGDWCENPGKYLGGYANRPNKFASLSEAQKKCLERGTNCGGVTYEPHSRKYTLRKSKELKDNGGNTAEITWVQCEKSGEEDKDVWVTIEGTVWHKHDLSAAPIEIRSDATPGDYTEMSVEFRDKDGKDAGGFFVYFKDRPTYAVYQCSDDYTVFPTTLPLVQNNNVWKLERTTTGLTVTCNDVVVLTQVLSPNTCGERYYNTIWTRKTTEISFKLDSASDSLKTSQACTEDNELFQCDEKCIVSKWRCDRENDCDNGDDEKGCSYH